MTYLIVETTDSKYEGNRIEMDSVPSVGDLFEYRDVEFKIKELCISKNTLSLVSDNYIIVLEKE